MIGGCVEQVLGGGRVAGAEQPKLPLHPETELGRPRPAGDRQGPGVEFSLERVVGKRIALLGRPLHARHQVVETSDLIRLDALGQQRQPIKVRGFAHLVQFERLIEGKLAHEGPTVDDYL